MPANLEDWCASLPVDRQLIHAIIRAGHLGSLLLRIILPACGFSVPVALAAADVRAEPADRPVTFARDVAPIFQQKCESCHRRDSLAPMSLVTYEEVRPWAGAIRTRVMTRQMPPWHIDKTVGIQPFANDRSLTDEQIDTIVRWVDAGAPLGDPKDLPPPVKWPSDNAWEFAEKLGPPDLVLKSPPYTVPARALDAWYKPTVDTGLAEPRCGLEQVPRSRACRLRESAAAGRQGGW